MGGDISYATTLGVIGYCVLPQFVLLIARFLGVYFFPFRVRCSTKKFDEMINCADTSVLQLAGIAWGAISSGTLLAVSSPKPMMIYFPMVLLYTYFDAVATN